MKYYAFIKRERETTLREIVRDISLRSTVTKADAMAVIENFLELVPVYMREGKIVNLGQFGTFKINLRSKGHVSPDQVNIFSIKGTRVVFTPSFEMKANLAGLRFHKATDSTSYEEEEEAA